ncbi:MULTISPECIES: hypothetical protein [Clostridia]|uniref:hypothetical protein n=1 Tax=Clostridia TaxID=186801 RepID=UPI000E51185C|nr:MULTISPECIES: hypothetical protein [Clostridia]RHV71016.1 hypothetical protein DXB15_03660 [Roseburia sp. OM02-15]
MTGEDKKAKRDFIKEYEGFLKDKEELNEEEYEKHLHMIAWVQHERLVHLIVTFGTGIGYVLSIILYWQIPHPLCGTLFLGLSILFACYVLYYCKLENMLRRWYLIQKK